LLSCKHLFINLGARGLRGSLYFAKMTLILLRGPPEMNHTRPPRPSTREDWDTLFAEVTEAFSPGAPIRERDLFAGRRDQIDQLIDAVRQQGRHAVIFGERGVGKTSLANTFALGLHAPTRQLVAEKINADPKDTFTSLWRKVFRRLSYSAEQNGEEIHRFVSDDYQGTITPDDVQMELSQFSRNTTPIIVIDEFDRIEEKEVSLLISDTIKALADYVVNCTIVIVGVADDIGALIGNHASISRQIIQVRMPRMTRDELAKIILDRLKRINMTIIEEVLWRATFLSRGLPYFTHLLGMHAARTAVKNHHTRIAEDDLTIKNHHTRIAEDDLTNGITLALNEVDQTLKERYSSAVISKKPRETTLYEPVLLACALAENDDLGRFQQKQIEGPLAAILPDKRYRATTYAFHMNEFCQEKRGRILDNSGEEQTPRYRFSDPMMQPYVILRGLAENRIDHSIHEKFTPQRQPMLSSEL
jgi:Cdc6-like AAA superfamily ATPase